jgi:hypothetical protein
LRLSPNPRLLSTSKRGFMDRPKWVDVHSTAARHDRHRGVPHSRTGRPPGTLRSVW